MDYCIDCENQFPREELEFCICDDFFGEHEFRIVTKSGVKYHKQFYLHCKNCLEFKHSHEGEAFI